MQIKQIIRWKFVQQNKNEDWMRDEYPTGQIRGENGGEPQEHTQS